MPEDVDELVLDLYRRLPEVRITDILLEVDAATGFTDAFTHLRTGALCQDRIGLLNVLLAEGLNLGLSKMAEASNTHDFFQLSRLSRWHIESEAIDRALAMVIEAQAQLPLARLWGLGLTASSDGQFFPAARQGEAMNLINARYGSEPGLKAYTHVSDRFGPFPTQTIPATVNEAPYILDGLLMTRAGRRIREQYADSGGFTDHVFAVTSLLGYRFIPRIRDLPSKRLHVFEPRRVPKPLMGLTGNKIREDVIVRNWPDILRVAATLASGVLPPSQLLRKFAAYPRQHELAVTRCTGPLWPPADVGQGEMVGRGRSKRPSRTGLARVGGDVRLSVGWLRHRRCRQAGSGIARSRARARLNWVSQGQCWGRCKVSRRAERVSRPARAKTLRRRVLVVTTCSPRPMRAVQRPGNVSAQSVRARRPPAPGGRARSLSASRGMTTWEARWWETPSIPARSCRAIQGQSETRSMARFSAGLRVAGSRQSGTRRRNCFSVSRPNQRSTRFSQEALVGVK